MPHGHCYLWEPALVWAQVLSNGAIGVAYIAIAIMLTVLVRRIEDLPFKLVYVAFAIFIVTCGLTHFMDVFVIWRPAYWLDASIRIATAIASVGTALLLPPLIPDAISLARGARTAERRGLKLEAVVDNLEAMYEQAKELEQHKTDFFANVSHELRTPLQLILGPADRLLESEAVADEDRRRVETIATNSRVLLKHVNDLLAVASMEAGQLTVDYARIDAARMVRRLVANFESLAERKRIDLQLALPEVAEAEVDPDKFESVVLNLLSNALKFTPDGGLVRCELRAEPTKGDRRGRLELVVADSGPGVPQAARETIFERFRQLDGSATRRFGGTGLGLVITRDFVELHGGTITVDEAPEGGARFRAVLPRTAPADAAVGEAAAGDDTTAGLAARLTAEATEAEARSRTEARTETRTDETPQFDADDHRPLVLVVEDNETMSDFIVESLGQDFRTAVAYDGRRGLELARQLVPDVVLSDVMMPKLSGDELVAELRDEPALDATAVILLTAKADDRLRVDLLRQGAQDYLMKPFHPPELLARVGNHATLARTRRMLQRELSSTRGSVEELAAELAGNRRDLQHALETTRVALDRAEEASRLKSKFLGLVSHELRTPVAALQLQLAVLEEADELSVHLEKPLARMSRSVLRLTELIESLLQRASIESGRMSLKLERVECGELTRQVAEEMSPLAEDTDVELRVEIADGTRSLTTDRRLLRLIMVNLVNNALKFTDEGVVTLGVDCPPGGFRFYVSDTGPGIPPEQRVRLFESFERGEGVADEQIPGVGLGLSLVRDLTEALGGSIELDSQVGKGSTFSIVLPWTQEDDLE